jgi:hypothetical protein
MVHRRKRRGVYRVLVGKPEVKRPLGRPKRRWENNTGIDLQEVERRGKEWINPTQKQMALHCEHDNILSDSIKLWEFF